MFTETNLQQLQEKIEIAISQHEFDEIDMQLSTCVVMYPKKINPNIIEQLVKYTVLITLLKNY